MDTPIRWNIYTAAEPTVTRIFPSLAAEIGLNESIVLLQIAWWINTSNNIRENRYWTYQSLQDMRQKAFGYWSRTTISRTIKTLEKLGYITVRRFNKRAGDNTQWFALCPEKLKNLKSIDVKASNSSEVFQNETGVFQNETGVFQNETTLPENSHRIPKENLTRAKRARKSSSKNHDDAKAKALIDAWCEHYQYGQIGETMYTASRMKTANSLLNWSPEVTVAEIKDFLQKKRNKIEFIFLCEPLSVARAEASHGVHSTSMPISTKDWDYRVWELTEDEG
jgi:hypothetical protein